MEIKVHMPFSSNDLGSVNIGDVLKGADAEKYAAYGRPLETKPTKTKLETKPKKTKPLAK